MQIHDNLKKKLFVDVFLKLEKSHILTCLSICTEVTVIKLSGSFW